MEKTKKTYESRLNRIYRVVNMNEVHAYTDGACSGNPGPGGWGAVLISNQHKKELSGAENNTTNNRMELLAVIEALRALKGSCHVTVTTDSQYVKNGITSWIKTWQKNGWKTANKKPVKNQDLWQQLEAETHHHNISWQWVKGHSGHPENELADTLARRAIEQL